MKTIILLFSFLIGLMSIQQESIANPVYRVTANNFVLNCGEYDTLSWDIHMLNLSAEPLNFAGGQLCFNFNRSIANGGTLLYRISGTDLPTSVAPASAGISDSTLVMFFNNASKPEECFTISSTYPGTRVARVRLITRSTTFSGNSFYPRWKDTLPEYYTKIFAYVGSFHTQITSSSNWIEEVNCGMFTNSPWECCQAKLLSLNVAIEGLFNSSTNRLNKKDSVTVELHSSTYPYELKYSAKCRLDSINLSSFHVFTFSWFPPTNFYLVIRHRNSIETWSKSLTHYSRNGEITYYNTTLSDTSAYGNNLKLKGSKFCVYSGDVNQDKAVNLTDVLLTYNDAQNFVSGYVSSDLNGDNVVNLEDISIASNNSASFVRAITPLSN